MKILIIRSAPSYQFNELAAAIRAAEPSAQLFAVAQENIRYLLDEGLFTQIFFIQPGMLSKKSLNRDQVKQIRALGIDRMVIPLSDHFKSVDNILGFAPLLTVPGITVVDRFGNETSYTAAGVRWRLFKDFCRAFARKTGAVTASLSRRFLPHGLYERWSEDKREKEGVRALKNGEYHFKNWPFGFSESIENAGIPLKIAGHFNSPLLESCPGDPFLFTFNGVSMKGVKLDKGVVHDLSSLAKYGKLVLPLCLPREKNAPCRKKELGIPDVYYRGQQYSDLELKVHEHSNQLNAVECGTWRYYTLEEGWKKASVSSARSDIVLGKPVVLDRRKKEKPGVRADKLRCFVVLVVDSLSEMFFNKYSFPDVMPHTKEFFKTGTYFTNHWAQSEWTLSSVATMLSGLYPSKHGVYQPNVRTGFSADIPLLSEVFSNEGYLTLASNSSWRINPLYGHARGFDRFVSYSHWAKDREIINDAVQQIRAFPEQDQFIYLHLLRLHNMGNPPFSPRLDVMTRIEDKINEIFSNEFDPRHERRFLELLKEIDSDLKFLYMELEDSFAPDELTVLLTSDHGKINFGKDRYYLTESRVNVPMLLRDSRLPTGKDDRISQHTDIYASLLKLAGIDAPLPADSKPLPALGGKERDYIIGESIYMTEYNLGIRDKEFVFRLKGFIENGKLRPGNLEKTLLTVDDQGVAKQPIDNPVVFKRFDSVAEDHIRSFPERLIMDEEKGPNPFVIL